MSQLDDAPQTLDSLRATLAETQKALEEERAARQAFVSLVTHELRTPMTSIKGYTDLLLKGIAGPVSDMQATFLETIRANTERMSKLVADLSDINKIDGGRLALSPSTFHVAATVSQVIESRRTALDERGHAVDVALADGLPTIIADRERFVQILGALLDNAIQYTPAGGHLAVTAEAEPADRVAITVRDDGIGIPEDEQAQVFEAFFRASDEATRAEPGNGLALHLAKRLLALQDGTVTFTSIYGEGSTFTFSLPTA